MAYASSRFDYKEVNDTRRHASTMNAVAPKRLYVPHIRHL